MIKCIQCKKQADWNTSFGRPSKTLCHSCYERKVNKLVKAGIQKPAAHVIILNELFNNEL